MVACIIVRFFLALIEKELFSLPKGDLFLMTYYLSFQNAVE